MYGYLIKRVVTHVENNFDKDVVAKFKAKLKIDDVQDGDEFADGTFTTVLELASKCTGQTVAMLGEELGKSYIKGLKTNISSAMLTSLVGRNVPEFINNLDYLHSQMRDAYPEMIPPSFQCLQELGGVLELHCYSAKIGSYHMVPGMVNAISEEFFNSPMTVSFRSVRIEKCGGQTSMEHAHYSLNVPDWVADSAARPTLIADTRKHCEVQVKKSQVDEVNVKMEQILKTGGVDAHPVRRQAIERAQKRWKKVQSMIRMAALFRGLATKFQPIIPESIVVTPRMFCHAYPYHVAFNSDCVVTHSGVKMQRAIPEIKEAGADLTTVFKVTYPPIGDLTIENMLKFRNTPFIMEVKQTEDTMRKQGATRPLSVVGQIMDLEDTKHYIYLCSPHVRNLTEAQTYQVFLGDIPHHDVTKEFYFAGATKHSAIDSDSRANAVIKQLEIDNDELHALIACAEREGPHQLAFLPPSIQEVYKSGRPVTDAMMANVSMMFVDICLFEQLISTRPSNEISSILGEVYKILNRLCLKYQLEMIESVGDALFATSTLNNTTPNADVAGSRHIADCCLTILYCLKNTTISGERINVRIGAHTGSMHGGIVEKSTPRLQVWGKDCHLCAKMESHGINNGIHATKAFIGKLGDGYKVRSLGQTEIRGEQPQETYEILSASHLTETVLQQAFKDAMK